MPKTLKKRKGGALNYSEYRGGANMEEKLKKFMKGGKRGGALNYSEYRGGANMEEKEDEMVGGKLRKRGGALNYSEYRGGANMEEKEDEMVGGKLRKRGGAPIHDNKLGDMVLKGGSKRQRKSVKRVKRGGTLGGMFGGMNTVTDTVNSLFGTKF